MTELVTLPPPPESIAAMLEIPGLDITPSVLVRQEGPEGHRGPEDAGAVLMLQATFTDGERAARFWAAAVPLMALLADAPGFIRRYSFADGPSITLLAFWRTVADARAFAATPQHRATVRGLYAQRWQYSHFSALWELASGHGRQVFCTGCDAVTPASDGVCRGCGAALLDPHRAATTGR
jgi:heme-degrading monooxygenase HmoA